MVSLDPLGTVECGLNIMMAGYSEKGKYGPGHTVPFRSFLVLSGPFTLSSLQALLARGPVGSTWSSRSCMTICTCVYYDSAISGMMEGIALCQSEDLHDKVTQRLGNVATLVDNAGQCRRRLERKPGDEG